MPGRHGDVDLHWGDGDHTFRLGLGQLRELQEKTNAGPFELLKRIFSGTWRVDDLRETIRLGLIGGGKKPVEALKLLTPYFDERPLIESAPFAQAILSAALFKVEGDPVGEAPARGEEAAPAGSNGSTTTADFPSGESTATPS